jgi:hypothetical protein
MWMTVVMASMRAMGEIARIVRESARPEFAEFWRELS